MANKTQQRSEVGGGTTQAVMRRCDVQQKKTGVGTAVIQYDLWHDGTVINWLTVKYQVFILLHAHSFDKLNDASKAVKCRVCVFATVENLISISVSRLLQIDILDIYHAYE